ncbi:MAG: hypothetical protein ABJ139_16675 [Paracoccaceae bacterium]
MSDPMGASPSIFRLSDAHFLGAISSSQSATAQGNGARAGMDEVLETGMVHYDSSAPAPSDAVYRNLWDSSVRRILICHPIHSGGTLKGKSV